MSLAPYLLGRRGPGAFGSSSDGGFDDEPIVTVTSTGDTTITGKVKPGAFGKFVYPVATLTAGRQYTFRYTPSFQRLAQQGKLAMVGFGLKNGNDFHIVGLRGDGATGLHKYKVNGTPPNGWNKDTGHTTSDGGAAANGTQAGPNWIRLKVSADGATYTFQTSADGSTWTTEYSAQTPTPFSNVSGVVTFGIALWFNNADAGPFSIVIDQFADAVIPTTTLDYRTTFTDNTSQTTFTFNGKDIGAADANRTVVLAFAWVQATQDRTVSLVTCNTNAMTLIDGAHTTTGGIYLYELAVAAGTTADFVITLSGSATRMIAATWRVIPAVNNTPVDHNIGTPAAHSQTAADVEVVSGGALICANLVALNATAPTPTYNGIDTPVSNSSGTLGTSGYLFWSCLTNEDNTANDPGATLPVGNNNQVRVCAASFH